MRKLLRMGLVLARVWRGQKPWALRTQKMLKLRVQMAFAAGKNESVSLSLFMEVSVLEAEEDLSTMSTLIWAEGVMMSRWGRAQQKAFRKQMFEVQTRRQVRGPAGTVMCETGDLGIQWPQWHNLLHERQAVNMRVVCPPDVRKMLLEQAGMV